MADQAIEVIVPNKVEGGAGREVVEHRDGPRDSASATLEMILRAVKDPTIDVDKLERLMAMHDKIVSDQRELIFDAAMAAAQAEMRPVAHDLENDQTHSSYSGYAALDRMARPIYSSHGFSLSFDEGDTVGERQEGWVRVLCYCAHREGFKRTYHIDLPVDVTGPKGAAVMTRTHATGSAMSYGQRYLLKLIFNIATGDFDDDGNAAGSGEKIDLKQYEELVALQQEADADTTKFLRYFKINTLDELPATSYEPAVEALEKKKADNLKNKGVE